MHHVPWILSQMHIFKTRDASVVLWRGMFLEEVFWGLLGAGRRCPLNPVVFVPDVAQPERPVTI